MRHFFTCRELRARPSGDGMLCAGFGHGVFTLHRLSPVLRGCPHAVDLSRKGACQWNETGDWTRSAAPGSGRLSCGVAVGLRVQAAGALLRREHVRVRTGREYDSDGG